MKRFLYTVLLVTAAAVAVQAQAPPPSPGPGPTPPGGRRMPGFTPGQMPRGIGFGMGMGPLSVVRVPPAPMLTRLEDELNLSEDQKTKVRSAMDKYNEKAKSVSEQSRTATSALQESMNASKFDAAKVKADAAKALKAEEGLVNASIDFWGEFRSVLTPEQNQKLSELTPRGRRMRMMRPGGPGGPGPGAAPPPPPPAPPAPGE